MSNLQERLLSTIPLQVECLESHLMLFKQHLKNGGDVAELLLSEALAIHSTICGVIDDLELLGELDTSLPSYLTLPSSLDNIFGE